MMIVRTRLVELYWMVVGYSEQTDQKYALLIPLLCRLLKGIACRRPQFPLRSVTAAITDKTAGLTLMTQYTIIQINTEMAFVAILSF